VFSPPRPDGGVDKDRHDAADEILRGRGERARVFPATGPRPRFRCGLIPPRMDAGLKKTGMDAADEVPKMTRKRGTNERDFGVATYAERAQIAMAAGLMFARGPLRVRPESPERAGGADRITSMPRPARGE